MPFLPLLVLSSSSLCVGCLHTVCVWRRSLQAVSILLICVEYCTCVYLLKSAPCVSPWSLHNLSLVKHSWENCKCAFLEIYLQNISTTSSSLYWLPLHLKGPLTHTKEINVSIYTPIFFVSNDFPYTSMELLYWNLYWIIFSGLLLPY